LTIEARKIVTNSPEEHIEKEVQRRLASKTRQHGLEIASLREMLNECNNQLVKQNNLISRLLHEPLVFGTILKLNNKVDVSKFKTNDEVIVVDKSSVHYEKGGRIVSDPPVDSEGFAIVKISEGVEYKFSVGLEGKNQAQIRLSKKDDGTFAVISLDGKPWEVRGIPDLGLKEGDSVKVKPDTKAIVSLGYTLTAGPICVVSAVNANSIEVMHKGDLHLIYNTNNYILEEGDRVATDPSMSCVIEKLPKDNSQRYKVSSDLNITWDDIGGLEETKQDLKDALELPFQQPELFLHYGIEPLRGVLLYGPPGCGKTYLARASAAAIATIHGKSAIETGYIYVKSPECLSKWVGNTEREIRELFERGRRHYRECGFKAILVFDEADALMPQRGTRRSSDVSDTIVPMFLGEMDGIDHKQTQENPIVFLLTNRADVLDPAITRPGRISRHIKVDRPTNITSLDILGIHTKKMPFHEEKKRSVILTMAVADLFSKSRLLYRINNEHDFTLGDCVSGAMLANIAEITKINALHRDLGNNKRTGVNIDDFRQAVQKVFVQQRGCNHSYDLEDFLEKKGLHVSSAKIDRCFGAA